MKDISVILPVESSKHKNFSELFTNAITSVKNQSVAPKELVLVHTNEESLVSYLKDFDFSGLTVNMVENKGNSDFASQMNLGVEKATSEWVSFLEFDEVIDPKDSRRWIVNALESIPVNDKNQNRMIDSW